MLQHKESPPGEFILAKITVAGSLIFKSKTIINGIIIKVEFFQRSCLTDRKNQILQERCLCPRNFRNKLHCLHHFSYMMGRLQKLPSHELLPDSRTLVQFLPVHFSYTHQPVLNHRTSYRLNDGDVHDRDRNNIP